LIRDRQGHSGKVSRFLMLRLTESVDRLDDLSDIKMQVCRSRTHQTPDRLARSLMLGNHDLGLLDQQLHQSLTGQPAISHGSIQSRFDGKQPR